MIYVVETTDSAELEFEEQYAYIARRSPQGAKSWAMAFRTALKQLEKNPASRPLAPESEQHAESIYQLPFKTRWGNLYRALFIIRENHVYVIHIRGQGQDVKTQGEIQFPEAD